MQRVAQRAEALTAALERASWVPKLLVRLFVGYFFIETGWGKLSDIGSFIERFIGWGVSAPAFTARLSAYTELLGGALILIGLATRLASVPLAINMLVATFAVRMKKVGSISDFVELDEPLYALVFVWFFFAGPGRISLDYLLFRFATRGSRERPEPHAPTAPPHPAGSV
jgi:putative oxidoreductase